MVFTHLPSNILLMLVPLMPNLSLAIWSCCCVSASARWTCRPGNPTSWRWCGRKNAPRRPGSPVWRALPAPPLPRARRASIRPARAHQPPFFIAGTLKIAYDLLLYRAFVRQGSVRGHALVRTTVSQIRSRIRSRVGRGRFAGRQPYSLAPDTRPRERSPKGPPCPGSRRRRIRGRISAGSRSRGVSVLPPRPVAGPAARGIAHLRRGRKRRHPPVSSCPSNSSRRPHWLGAVSINTLSAVARLRNRSARIRPDSGVPAHPKGDRPVVPRLLDSQG